MPDTMLNKALTDTSTSSSQQPYEVGIVNSEKRKLIIREVK